MNTLLQMHANWHCTSGLLNAASSRNTNFTEFTVTDRGKQVLFGVHSHCNPAVTFILWSSQLLTSINKNFIELTITDHR